MPPKRKTKGKKRRTIRKRLSSAARGAKRRASAAARYARRNPGRTAAGLAGLGYAGLEGYLAAKRHGLKKGRSFTGPQGLKEAIEFEKFKRSNPYASPTATAFRRGRRGVTAARDYFNDPNRDIRGDISRRAGEAYESVRGVPGRVGRAGSGFLDRLFPGRVQRRNAALELAELQRMAAIETDGRMRYGKRKRRRRKFGKLTKQQINAITLQDLQNNSNKLKELKDYARTGEQCYRDLKKLAGLSVVGTGVGLGYQGYKAYKSSKRKKKRKAAAKRRKRKSSFGKKAKKPSAATKRMCKKLKVRLTTKRGGKRVYKSEAMLKKQCKKAMKRKSKK